MGERAIAIQRDSEVDQKIIEMMCEGKLLGDIAKQIGCGINTIHSWRVKDPLFASECSRALECGMELIFEQILSIPDTYDDVNRARLKVDAIKIYASKMYPAKYGDRLDVNVTNVVSIGDALEEARNRVIDVTQTVIIPQLSSNITSELNEFA